MGRQDDRRDDVDHKHDRHEGEHEYYKGTDVDDATTVDDETDETDETDAEADAVIDGAAPAAPAPAAAGVAAHVKGSITGARMTPCWSSVTTSPASVRFSV